MRQLNRRRTNIVWTSTADAKVRSPPIADKCRKAAATDIGLAAQPGLAVISNNS
jgi:hypothetical protein